MQREEQTGDVVTKITLADSPNESVSQAFSSLSTTMFIQSIKLPRQALVMARKLTDQNCV